MWNAFSHKGNIGKLHASRHHVAAGTTPGVVGRAAPCERVPYEAAMRSNVVFPRIAVAARRLVCTALQTQQHTDGNDNLG
jgi:hypothetical protein